jgi:hypothetical protein
MKSYVANRYWISSIIYTANVNFEELSRIHEQKIIMIDIHINIERTQKLRQVEKRKEIRK